MFFETPYKELGFTTEEWEQVTPGDRRIIRSYIHNGYNELRTVLYDEHETDFKVRTVVHKYQINERPHVKITYSSFTFY